MMDAHFSGFDVFGMLDAYEGVAIGDVEARLKTHLCEDNAVLSVVLPS